MSEDEYGEEYGQSCWECGFNQKDEDERDEKEKQAIYSEIVTDLKSLLEDARSGYVDGSTIAYMKELLEKYQEKIQK